MTASVALTPEQIVSFRARGFVTLDAITTPDELERLREIFVRLFTMRAGREKGRHFDLAGTDEEDRPAGLPQVLNPLEFAPELAETQFRANALAIAKQLLGDEAIFWFEHSILKPAGYGAATPWHQDEAHRNDPGSDYEQISIWMPLQEATAANGCMEFIPGSHRGPVLRHWSPNDDPRVTALECVGDFDPARAELCPLPAGGATVHHCRTLHHAGPNVSDIPRYAYILAFRGKSTPNPAFTGYAWNAVKRTAAQARRAASQPRQGWLTRQGQRASRAPRKAVTLLRQAGKNLLNRG
jgi:ectoine hydroxylase-related dioxygenase (phytanoyl-CoA dioxygenase family)